jgi:hypothetical protein
MVAFEWTVAILQSRNGMESMALVALQLAVIFKTLPFYSTIKQNVTQENQ